MLASAGGFVGYGLNMKITSSQASGNVTNTSYTFYDQTVGSYGSTYIKANAYAGGFMGGGIADFTDITAKGDVLINQIKNTAGMNLSMYAGGLIGSYESGNINKAFAEGKVSTKDVTKSKGYVTTSRTEYNRCNTCGGDYTYCPHHDGYEIAYDYDGSYSQNPYTYTYAGGLIGISGGFISDSYSTSQIDIYNKIEDGSLNIGGLVGYTNNGFSARTSYFAGSVTKSGIESKNTYIGSLSGYGISKSATFLNCFYDKDKSGINSAYGAYRSSNNSGFAGSIFVQDRINEIKSNMSVSRITETQARALGYTVIRTAAEFADFLNSTDNGANKTFILMSDIDMKDITNHDTAVKAFTGTLDGNGYTIKNYNSSDAMFTSLNGTVRNLKVDNATVSSNNTQMGIIARNMNNGKIENTYVTGNVFGTCNSTTYAGGLVGHGYGTIINSGFNGTVSTISNSTSYNGGLIGYTSNTTTISSSFATGVISSTNTGYYTGGLVGYLAPGKATIADSAFDGTMSSNSYGLTGNSADGVTNSIYNSGRVTNEGTNIKDGSTVYGLSTEQMSNADYFTPHEWNTSVWNFGSQPHLKMEETLSNASEWLPNASTLTSDAVVQNRGNNVEAFKGQKNGLLKITAGTETYEINISSTDSLNQILTKINNTNVMFDARINADGKNAISFIGRSVDISISDTSGFAEFYGLLSNNTITWEKNVSETYAEASIPSSATKYFNTVKTTGGNVLTLDTISKGGTIKIGSSSAIDTTNKTIAEIISLLNNILPQGVHVSLDSETNKFSITSEIGSVSITTTGEFAKLTGLNNYNSDTETINANKTIEVSDLVKNENVSAEEPAYQIIGGNTVNSDDIIISGSIQIENGVTINTAGKTLQEIADLINEQKQPNIQALIDDGKFVIKFFGSSNAPAYTAAGDFARVTGLGDYSIGASTTSITTNSSILTGSVTVASGTSTSAFKGQTAGILQIAVTGVGLINITNIQQNDTVGTVLGKINAANTNLSATIRDDGKISISYNGKNTGISIGNDTTGFSEFYGLKSTSKTWTANYAEETPDYTSVSKSTITGSASGLNDKFVFAGQTGGSFDIYLGETFLKSIVVSSTDTIGDVLAKINGGNLQASLVNGHIQISTATGSTKALSVVTFSGNWADLAGLRSGDFVIQANPNKSIGAMSDLTYTGATVKGMTGSHVFSGLQGGTFRIYMNNTTGNIPVIRVNATDTVDEILERMKAAISSVGGTLNASVKNGQIVISTSSDFATSISFGNDTSGFLKLAGLSTTKTTYDANYTSTDAVLGSDMFLGSVKGITENHIFGGLTAGNMTISAGDTVITISIKENSSVKDIADQIKASGKFTAGLVNGQFFIQSTTTGSELITVESTSNFAQLTGLKDGVFSGEALSSSGGGNQSRFISSVTGLQEDSKFSYTSAGYFLITAEGAQTVQINVNSDTTIGHIIEEINISTDYQAKLDDEGRLVIETKKSTGGTIKISNGTTNFAKIIGLNAGYISNKAVSVKGDSDIASSLSGSLNNLLAGSKFSAGDFKISVESPDGTIKEQTFTLTGSETLYTILNRITASDLGVKAEYKNGGVTLTAKATGAYKLSIADGTSDFAEKTGFTTDGTQKAQIIYGSQPDLTSQNTIYSAISSGFSAGNFYISLTDKDGNITKTTQINVLENDTIDNIINKIKNSDSGVTAAINSNDKLVLTMNSDMNASAIVINKGTSDFTNKIGFTNGGYISSEAVFTKGEAVGKTTVSSKQLNASFSDTLLSLGITEGNFKINGKIIQVSHNIQTLIDNINASFSENDLNGVRASLSGGKIILTATSTGSDAIINIEAGSSNFTETAGFTTNVTNNTNTQVEGKNALFELNGKTYERSSNTIYLDKDGNITDILADSAIRLIIKNTGTAIINIDSTKLSSPIDKLSAFVSKFNTVMSSASNPQISSDAGVNAILSKIKSALTSDINGEKNTLERLKEIGINIYEDSNGTKIYLEEERFTEQYLTNPSNINEILIGDDTKPLNYYKAGVFTRLSDTMANTKSYFTTMVSSLTNQKNQNEKEVTMKKAELNDLQNQALYSGNGSGGDNSDVMAYLEALEEKFDLFTELLLQMQGKGGSGSGSSVSYVLNRNNRSFNPIL